ncbi:hypothetical protein D9619_001339 [Psilocybe cf. subviscida]|uniref:SMP-30/Gluconolactonase/LRE-like region domain-containing protein n=1 Tax=Psilocybe cf. subviscida TaxID=2480587 RepID=A0A8H5F2I0_9AGAR|nr:hypothetical protein D9619_001339 [Psilocybe cf. subviscida]
MPFFGSTLTLTTALLALILAGAYTAVLGPLFTVWGITNREFSPVNNKKCTIEPLLPACEKIVQVQPSGILYLACSKPSSRTHWTPAVGRLNETGASFDDYVATYDPKSRVVTKLTVRGFSSTRGLSLHGMDVVPSATDSDMLFVYLVNHRAPLRNGKPVPAKDVGADSVIEIFKTTLGGREMTHVKTVEDDIIITPNDVIGEPDGASFYFTNDRDRKVGHGRELEVLGRGRTSVGFCHANLGCHYAVQNMLGCNGIARAPNGTVYVADSIWGGISILERQADNTLVLTDKVATDRALDNLMVDSNGHVWAAGFPYMVSLLFKHFNYPDKELSPSSAIRFSINTGKDAAYGKKYNVDKVFEDDGKIASGVTSAVYDADRKLLFMNGLASPHLAICKLK